LQEIVFEQKLDSVLSVFDSTKKLWTQRGKSSYGIKDNKEFTELLLQRARESFIRGLIQEDSNNIIYEGTVFRIIAVFRRVRTLKPLMCKDFSNFIVSHQHRHRYIHRDEFWFGFIRQVNRDEDNVYFDSRGYSGNLNDLLPGTRVRFEKKKNAKGYYASSVQALNQ
jgi:cold shock CspA family protein